VSALWVVPVAANKIKIQNGDSGYLEIRKIAIYLQ